MKAILPMLALLMLVGAAAAPDAFPSCDTTLTFGQGLPDCSGDFCSVVSPASSLGPSRGTFWSLATGDPLACLGDDGGTLVLDDWTVQDGRGRTISGDWTALGPSGGEVDGCILGKTAAKGVEVQVAAFSDQDAGGAIGYYAAAAVERLAGAYDFEFSRVGSDILLAEIPHPTIVSSQGSPGTVTVMVVSPSPPALEAAFFTDGIASLPDVVVGYRIYRAVRPTGAPAPSSRDRAAWRPATAVVPIGQSVAVTVPCEGNSLGYLATAVAFDGGFESEHVSANSSSIFCQGFTPCGVTDFDGDGVLEYCDLCPSDYDAPQTDSDADGQGDACDLDDAAIGIVLSGASRVSWQAELGYDSWNLYRGALSVLRSGGPYTQAPGSNPLATQWCGLHRTCSPDASPPGAGDVAHYLVAGVSAGIEGSLGTDSTGATRTNANPCP